MKIMGIQIQPWNQAELIARILRSAKSKSGDFYANININAIYHYYYNMGMRAALDSTPIITLDSFPLYYWARILGAQLRKDHRTTGIDYLPQLLMQCEREQLSVLLLGGHPRNTANIQKWVRQRCPKLEFTHSHGFFGKNKNQPLGTVKSKKPDLVLLAMGMPHQEIWAHRHRDQLANTTLVVIGATFDYFTGLQKTPPRWLGPLCLEGVYRLLCDPARLWKRYILYPLMLTPVFFRDVVTALKSSKLKLARKPSI